MGRAGRGLTIVSVRGSELSSHFILPALTEERYTGDVINVSVDKIIIGSLDYQKLVEEIEDKKESLEDVPDSKPERRLKISQKIQVLEKQLEQFKQDVIRLYEIFTKIEINTERLKQAKEHFEKVEFREADAILKAEEMTDDLNKLIEKDKQLDKAKEEVRENREQIANEFLIRAC